MSIDELRSHLVRIEQNHKDREGPCSDCPHWHTCGFKRPFYGTTLQDTLDAKVMFVGSEPGTGGEPEHISWMEGEENLSNTEAEARLDTNPRSYPRNNSAMFEESDLEKITQGGAFDYYITNFKKCHESYSEDDVDDSDVSDREMDGGYREAADNCSVYFEEEMTLLEPTVIVSLGKKSSRQLFDLVDELPYKSYVPNVSNMKCIETDQFTVIPALHPGSQQYGSFSSEVDFDMLGEKNEGESAKEAYYRILGDKIRSFL